MALDALDRLPHSSLQNVAAAAGLFLLLAAAGTVHADRLDPQATLAGPPAVTAAPEGGFLAVWPRWQIVALPFGPNSCQQVSLVGALLGDDGGRVGPLHEVRLPGGEVGTHPRLATSSEGDVLLSWTSPAGLQAGPLDGFAVDRATLLTSCAPRSHALVAAGDGFWVAWSEACGALRVRARRFDGRGRPQGSAFDLVAPSDEPGAGLAIAGRSDGGFYAAWVQDVGDIPRRLVGGHFDPEGTLVNTYPVSAGTAMPGTAIAASRLPGDGVVIAWENGDRTMTIERFASGFVPQGRTVQAAETTVVPEDGPVLATGPGGFFVLAWHRPLPGEPVVECPLRVYSAELEPLTGELFLPEGCAGPTALAFARDGSLLATWDQHLLADNLCPDTQVAPLAPDPLPPPVPPIGLDRFPGFAFRVRIGGDEPAPRIGTEDPVCVPETLCVGGALPGRSEVLVRIVGPKPNGYLWPTVVRFTTATVELWIEQLATGRARYYRLPGPGPSSSELPGFFDRTGFEP